MNDLRVVYSAPSVKQALRVRQSIADFAAGLGGVVWLPSVEDFFLTPLRARMLEPEDLKRL